MLQKTSEPIELELLQRIGNTLKTRRQALRLSQIDLADKAQIHRTYIGNIEHGTRNITVSILVRLARALDIPFTEIADLVDHIDTHSNKKSKETDSATK
ncbi:MAG: helix-turn-helix transcriptional regulator [Candidatus Obscuribacterales bacterium]|nr:helix-turn-helix transcriptional regulator [Candidatus Obscuribacterales bacterium]